MFRFEADFEEGLTDWIYHPTKAAGLTQEEEEFLEKHEIGISSAYIGMARAYRSAEHYPDNKCKVIWQTSCAANLLSVANDGNTISEADLAKQLKDWVVHLMNLSPAGLERVFNQNIGLLST